MVNVVAQATVVFQPFLEAGGDLSFLMLAKVFSEGWLFLILPIAVIIDVGVNLINSTWQGMPNWFSKINRFSKGDKNTISTLLVLVSFLLIFAVGIGIASELENKEIIATGNGLIIVITLFFVWVVKSVSYMEPPTKFKKITGKIRAK